MRKYFFRTTCVHSTGKLINAMINQSKTVTYRTMMKHCEGMLEFAKELGYNRSRSQGLTLKRDWAVSYHKSFYDGWPCYYFRWSAIEHIWIKEAS